MKKDQTIKKVMVNALAAMLIIGNGFASRAASTETISILPNQIWSVDSDCTDSRSGNYDSVLVRLYSVWPNDGSKDTFSRIKAQATNGYGLVITNEHTLNETDTSPTAMSIDQGYLKAAKRGELDLSTVGFQFRGNTNKAAYATVYYYGR